MRMTQEQAIKQQEKLTQVYFNTDNNDWFKRVETPDIHYTDEQERECIVFGNISYYNLSGQLHNSNGPAQISNDGVLKIYYLNDFIHRLDGPAIIQNHSNSITKESYYSNGLIHRLDGPAIIYIQEEKVYNQYFINGLNYTEEEYETIIKDISK